MKGTLKHLSLLCFFFSFLLASNFFFIQASISNFTIYTRITGIDFPPSLIYKIYYPNQTFFEFESSIEIINPSGQTLYILSHTTCLVFTFGNLLFEDENYEGSVGGPYICGNMFTNHTIEPGISEGRMTFDLSVNNTLDSLPSGNFTIWIHLDDSLGEHNYVHFSSIISVNGTAIHVTHTGANETFTFPTVTSSTPTSTSALSIVVPCFLGILVILLKKYNRLP